VPTLVHSFLQWLGTTKFSELMVQNRWWWAFLMDMHFIGLTLLLGTIGLLDLRILGFIKELPIAPLNKLVPWGVAGFLINVITGICAIAGMPLYYGYDLAFWLKMLFISLAGMNLLTFYVTNSFRKCQEVGSGQDAPLLAKFIAGTSLFLWFGVIVLGRYIQLYQDTIKP